MSFMGMRGGIRGIGIGTQVNEDHDGRSTYKQMIEKIRMSETWKIFAIPTAIQRRIQRIPVLLSFN